MKAATIFAGLLVLGPIASGQTAYEALRSLGQAKGEDILNQVVEVTGKDGVPQPEAWTVVTADPMARGGVRVFGIAQGRIESEHTPIVQGGAEPAPIDFNRLNLDSPGAFKVAEQEAVRSRVGFDRVDYQLQASPRGGSPVWVITLIDGTGNPAATVDVAAENGEVMAFRSRGGAQESFAQDDRRYLEEETAPSGGGSYREDTEYREYREERVYREDRRGNDRGVIGSLERFGKRVGRHFQRDGAALERFFTGETSIDPDEDNP